MKKTTLKISARQREEILIIYKQDKQNINNTAGIFLKP